VIAVDPAWHEVTMQLNYDGGLAPYFGAFSIADGAGGSRETIVESDGERWVAKLYTTESGIVDPGPELPTGTPFEFENVRECRIHLTRQSDEDPTGEQKIHIHLRPRWQGMEVDPNDGDPYELSIPDEIEEGINVRLSGSNVDAGRYRMLLADAAAALGLNRCYFADPLDSSTVTDAERYVRIHGDESGPIHAREGPLASLGHLLENDRTGYRKVVQNDTDDDGRDVPGYYHTVTLGPTRVREAFPSVGVPVECKHYLARKAADMDDDDGPLAHPKVGASYQVSRWDGSVGVTDDDLGQLRDELDTVLLAVLKDVDLPLRPGDGEPGRDVKTDGEETYPFVEDAYFDAAATRRIDTPPDLPTTELRSEQENVVIREVAKTGGISPVEREVYETLLSDGGRVSPADIAEEHGRHVGSVRRALRRIDDVIERKYGEVAFQSSYVAELVHDAVDELRSASRRVTNAAGEALLAAERELDEATSALRAWLARYDVEVDSRREAVETIRLGEVERRGSMGYAKVYHLLRDGLVLWTDAGRDASKFRGAEVEFRFSGRGRQTMDVASPTLLG
jgi:hypothetical protein